MTIVTITLFSDERKGVDVLVMTALNELRGPEPV